MLLIILKDCMDNRVLHALYARCPMSHPPTCHLPNILYSNPPPPPSPHTTSSVGRNVEETLRLVKAFQYSDAHVGEACPASWQPGDDSIKADPWGAKEYFTKHNKD